jgi:hypothetical protein
MERPENAEIVTAMHGIPKQNPHPCQCKSIQTLFQVISCLVINFGVLKV